MIEKRCKVMLSISLDNLDVLLLIGGGMTFRKVKVG